MIDIIDKAIALRPNDITRRSSCGKTLMLYRAIIAGKNAKQITTNLMFRVQSVSIICRSIRNTPTTLATLKEITLVGIVKIVGTKKCITLVALQQLLGKR